MNYRLRVVAVFVFVVLAMTAFGKDVRIFGKVRDNDNKPMEAATVKVAGKAIGTNTGKEGEYVLSTAGADTLKIVFSFTGFKTVEHTLIKPEGEVRLNVKMYPEDHLLKEVVALGFRGNINGMQSFSVGDYRLSPDVSGGSIEAMIATLPGVNANNELSSRYSVRGGSFDENSVYINGMEIYRPQLVRSGQQEGLSIINPMMTGNIRFSSGGFPARYADKMSSALDITYREPEKFEAGIDASLSGGSMLLGGKSKKISMLHGLRVKRNNSLLATQETKGEYDPLFVDYQTNMRFNASERFNLDFLGNISHNRFNFMPSDRETSFGTMDDSKQFKVYFDGREKDIFETYVGWLNINWKSAVNTALSFGIGGFMTNEFVSNDISGEYWLDQAGTTGDEGIGGESGVGKYMEHTRNRLKGSVLTASIRGITAVGKNRLTYGASWSRESLRDRTREWEWRDSAGYSLPNHPEEVRLFYNLSSRQDVKSDRFAAFAEDAIRFESGKVFVSLNAGVRVSYWDFNREFLFSPRVNVSISPVDNRSWTFRVAGGVYYQSPFYKEYRGVETDDQGNGTIKLNRNLESPRSIQAVAATDYVFSALGRPFKITGEVYFKSMSRLVSYEYENLKAVYSGKNDSKGGIYGCDFKMFGQFVPGSDSWLSISLMHTSEELNGKRVPMPSDQRYSLGLYFTDYFPRFPKLKFALRGVLSDGLTMTAPRTSRSESWFRAPSYKRLDAGVSYMIIGENTAGESRRKGLKSLEAGADLYNLFDIANVGGYYWVTDVNDIQYAVPNYLTRRLVNIWLSLRF